MTRLRQAEDAAEDWPCNRVHTQLLTNGRNVEIGRTCVCPPPLS